MMKGTILYFSRALQSTLFPKIAQRLTEYDAVHIVRNLKDEANVKAVDSTAVIYNISDYLRTNWYNPSLNTISLSEIEKKCGFYSVWKILYSDYRFTNCSYDDAIKFIKLHYLFIVKIIDEHHPKFFVNEEVSFFSAYMFFAVCRSRGCKYIGFSVPRNHSCDHVLFSQDQYTHYQEMDFYYQNSDLSDEDFKKAKDEIDYIKAHRVKPEYMKKMGEHPTFLRDFMWPSMVYLKKKIFLPTVDKFDYETYCSEWTHQITYFRYWAEKKYYQEPGDTDKFILFPLHYQPEASTLVKATDFVDQASIVELLSKNIPGDYILYVKEHYAKLGHRPVNFYKRVSKLPNVRIIDPLVDSHELIKKASAVVVLSSTVGWEALMYTKPVFILGNVFYDSFKYCYKVDNVFNLSNIIKKEMVDFSSRLDQYKNDYLKYFAAYLKAAHTGNYDLSNASMLLKEDNIDNLSKAVKENIKFLERV